MAYITREQLMIAIGLREPEPVASGVSQFTELCYQREAEKIHVDGDRGPHELAWNLSFHASQFPGGMDKPCGRQAMYRMLNIPEDQPTPPWLVAVADAGKDIEMQFVNRWHRAGVLLSAPPDAEWQTHYEDSEHWLTCSVDSILDPRTFGSLGYPIPVDVKGKDHMIVERLRDGTRLPDPGHVRQLMVQIHFVREMEDWSSLGLSKCEGGVLLYASRQRPLTQFEAFIPYDDSIIEHGLEILSRWRMLFELDVLPERPKSWRWTEEPCKWCSFKHVCKVDIRNDTDELSKSAAIAYAKSVRPNYDMSTVKNTVLKRWEAK